MIFAASSAARTLELTASCIFSIFWLMTS